MLTKRLQIGDIAHLLGITPKAIRHYHQLGLLDDAPRADNGYRVYGVEHLERLQTIVRLQRMGLSLKQIGFILHADDPDALLESVLYQRHAALTDEITRLQHKQARIHDFLQSGISVQRLDTPPAHSAMTVMRDTLKPISNGLADILVAVESDTLARIDHYRWSAEYEAFWEQIGVQLAQRLLPDEHIFILWMERYLALAAMPLDDWQAQAWLGELHTSAASSLLARAFQLPPSSMLPPDEQSQLQRLMALMLYEHASPLQKAFIATALSSTGSTFK
ncbi:MAG: MerR family transcriptional regulator [Chloroflexota bacterium]|nr:MerR family transcriptional regulator [Chloroflexota bacterium]